MAPLGGIEDAIGPGLGAHDDVVVVAVLPDQAKSLPGDVLGADLAGEAAEEDAAVRADALAAGGEQFFDGVEVGLLRLAPVAQRGRGDEADVTQPAGTPTLPQARATFVGLRI
ncbi:hypothetical protein Ari01nite_81240 [Paractinoplanes rishiriensis]|uniref:Uncharacterized protein n=1 Tax=Paractinoplanes rishiriensis TaxID=1050105 RepID=A0A919MZ20_9ACTN|nr:hypothetical protein Ari01nite_81240 [Actinoplanes rishiriensis]